MGLTRRIVGAWKIGSVLDSAAVPMVDVVDGPHMLNSALNPARAFADQCNVGIEWLGCRDMQRMFGGDTPLERVHSAAP